jgi:hypothetical protein
MTARETQAWAAARAAELTRGWAEASWQTQREQLTAALVAAYNRGEYEGVGTVLRIRCLPHRDVPAFNGTESGGGECAACAVFDALAKAGDGCRSAATDLAAVSGFEAGRADAAIESENLRVAYEHALTEIEILRERDARYDRLLQMALERMPECERFNLRIERWREILDLRKRLVETEARASEGAIRVVELSNESRLQKDRSQRLLNLVDKMSPGIDELHAQGFGCPWCEDGDGDELAKRFNQGDRSGCELIAEIDGVLAEMEPECVVVHEQAPAAPTSGFACRFICPECGPVAADEDGCCAACGRDCAVVESPAVAQADGGAE